MSTERAAERVEAVFRDDRGRLIAILAARFGDLELAEEVASQAIEAALGHWAVLHLLPPSAAFEAQTALTLRFLAGLSTSEVAQAFRVPVATMEEAIRLARILHRLLPQEREVTGLLALMLLIDARRLARVDAAGEPVSLADQDRSRWDAERIAESRDRLPRSAGLRQQRARAGFPEAATGGTHSGCRRSVGVPRHRIRLGGVELTPTERTAMRRPR